MGDIEGKSLNYYITYEECMTDAMEQEKMSPAGISFTCVEDVLR